MRAETRTTLRLKTLVWPALFFGLILFAATGCEYLSTARLYAGKGVARAVEGECALSTSQRQANVDAINADLSSRGSIARAVALDCDGDGAPDF